MDFQKYFQNELIALRSLGNEAAKRNPALAPFFDTPGGDPAVEHLLEGFSFLTGRLREKLDDELPEITHGLFSLLWPNYLRPFPATSIIQYRPTGNVTGSTTIPKGTLIKSIPVEGIPCTFQTVYDTQIAPIKIVDQWFFERNGTNILAVRFALLNGTLQSVPISSLRFLFTGGDVAAYTLYFTLLRKVREVRVVLRDTQREEHITGTLDPRSISPVGFREQERLYPYPEHTRLGYRVLQEYFAFPAKFLFVEIGDLNMGLHRDLSVDFQQAKEFELHFVLTELPETYTSLSVNNWKLFCTPIVNLFPLKTNPVCVEKPHKAYKIIPNPQSEHFKVYSVDSVSYWSERKKKNIFYEDDASFSNNFYQEHFPARYKIAVMPTLDGKDAETYLALNSVDNPGGVFVELQLTCTNGALPQKLASGDICIPAQSGAMAAMPFVGILPVESPLPPPIRKDILWKLLSNMSLNCVTLSDLGALRSVLSTYHFRAMHDHQSARQLERLMRGILAVKSTETDRIVKGMPMRGVRTVLTLDRECFSCEGELYLFGAVLNEFFSLYSTRVSFQQLTVISIQNEYQWPERLWS